VKGFNNTRRALLATSAAVAMLAAAACSSGSDNEGGPGPLPTDDVTLTMWWWGNEDRAKLQQDAIDAFEAKYPYIHIKGEPQVFDGYFDALGTRFAADDAPDLFTLGGAYPKSYGTDELLLDLSAENVSQEIDLSTFSDGILASARVDDKIFGVPTGGNTIAVLANPALFKQAGVDLPDDDAWTWDDFADLANELSDKLPDGYYGAEIRPWDVLGAYAGQRSPLYTDDDLAVDASVLEDFFQLEKDLADSGASLPAGLAVETQGAQAAQTLFGQGKAAMIFSYANQIGTYANAAGNPADGTDDAVLLRLPGETEFDNPGTTLLPSQYFAASATTPYPRQAALFLDFLVNDPAAAKILGTNRGIPSSSKALAGVTADLSGYDKASFEFMTDMNSKFGATFVPPAWATQLEPITKGIESEVLNGQITPAQGAQQWIDKMKDTQEAAS